MLKIIFSLSLLLTGTAWASDNEPEAPADTTIWVYRHSAVKDCDGIEASQAEVDQGTAQLTAKGVRVLNSEKNISPEAKAKGRKCGDGGGYVACFQIFGTDKKTAQDLGFKKGGLCGTPASNRVH